ncbi:uncharacterized protein LOC117891428 isoform X2 [Drosophila subobscura]|uniref:uncharacterized protein LOC117891428 isoform X2 n=1 Tax=Drosophila subobscura TaxID=7241 RepID=UPI00155A3484|nr:uncharacterized protein LOC117891428 isoform X2 [Drosophila subobscura]
MSISKSFLGCLMVAVVMVTMLHSGRADIETNEVNDQDVYMLQGVRVYPNDRQCVMVGGLCVKTSDCTEPTNNKGLCPTSVHQGVECCYELRPKPEYRPNSNK